MFNHTDLMLNNFIKGSTPNVAYNVKPVDNYMFKINNRNTRTRCEIYFLHCCSVSSVNFEQPNDS